MPTVRHLELVMRALCSNIGASRYHQSACGEHQKRRAASTNNGVGGKHRIRNRDDRTL
jgi:hypothetical protein